MFAALSVTAWWRKRRACSCGVNVTPRGGEPVIGESALEPMPREPIEAESAFTLWTGRGAVTAAGSCARGGGLAAEALVEVSWPPKARLDTD